MLGGELGQLKLLSFDECVKEGIAEDRPGELIRACEKAGLVDRPLLLVEERLVRVLQNLPEWRAASWNRRAAQVREPEVACLRVEQASEEEAHSVAERRTAAAPEKPIAPDEIAEILANRKT
jgi:hypothetical protein